MSRTPLDWLNLLRAHTARFAETLDEGDLEAPVTFCPGWTLRDLVVHLGAVHQWAAHAVIERTPEFQPEPAGRARPELAAWYRAHASRLVQVLTERPANAPAWTMDDRNPTAGFWRRRQVHETVIHVWDAEEALGEPRPIDPSLAWDGVLEVVGVIYPRQVRLGRIEPLTGAVSLIATDLAGDVILGDGDPVVVRHRAEILLRLLWHRAGPHADTIDPRASELLSAAVTP